MKSYSGLVINRTSTYLTILLFEQGVKRTFAYHDRHVDYTVKRGVFITFYAQKKTHTYTCDIIIEKDFFFHTSHQR